MASAVSTVQPAAVTAADVPKQESAVATYAPITSVISAAPSTAASVLPSASVVTTPAPVVFKQ